MNKILMWGLCWLNWLFFIIGLALKDYSIVAMLVMLGLQVACILGQGIIFAIDNRKFKKEQKRLDALMALEIMKLDSLIKTIERENENVED